MVRSYRGHGEHQTVTGVWRTAPSGVQGQSPGQGVRGGITPETENFDAFAKESPKLAVQLRRAAASHCSYPRGLGGEGGQVPLVEACGRACETWRRTTTIRTWMASFLASSSRSFSSTLALTSASLMLSNSAARGSADSCALPPPQPLSLLANVVLHDIHTTHVPAQSNKAAQSANKTLCYCTE